MSRFLSRLSELQPELFAELSPELAAEVGVCNGDPISIVTPRGAVGARALVTRRMRPLTIDGRTVHQVAIPFHWGSAGPLKGDVVNDLIPLSGDPNVSIHESKALLCAVLSGAPPRGPELLPWLEANAQEGRSRTPQATDGPDSTAPRPSSGGPAGTVWQPPREG
jgi:formate dehydrogenase major subunit